MASNSKQTIESAAWSGDWLPRSTRPSATPDTLRGLMKMAEARCRG